MWLRRSEYDALKEELATAKRQLDDARTLHMAVVDRSNAAVDEKMAILANELEIRHQLEIKNAVLLERLDLLTTFNTPQPSNFVGTQGSNEEVEDIEYAYRNGQINASDYEDALAAAGFQNTTIEFPSGDSYRL